MPTVSRDSSRRRVRLATILFIVAGLAGATAHVASASTQPIGNATATVETDPVATAGDAADDPAIWVHPTNPSRSVVIGNDKGGALEVYDLSGRRIQRLTGSFFGNVDVRHGFRTGTGTVDIVVASRGGIRIYAIDPSTRRLTNITDSPTGSIATAIYGEGLCLYRSPRTGETSVITNARNGRVMQHVLLDADGDGKVEAVERRSWDVGLETEGCVADDVHGHLYISEELVGVWRYDAEPSAPTSTGSRVLVERVQRDGGRIRPDAEGLTIVDTGGGDGYLIVSSQAASNTANSFLVYDRRTNRFIREFKVVTGTAADGCGRTDGIDATAESLGPAFPRGMFVCQDNTNTSPRPGRQNFKFVPLERVVGV